ncbi:MAG TPA: hypothetical protein VFX86_04165 [Candidatus Saccharimonadales bacterium]|nr:hypothetical protein [Candidatus Saccharimonadales bacterium]
MRINIKRLLVLASLVLFFALIWFFVRYFTTGKLVIETNDKNTLIMLQEVSGDGKPAAEATGSLSTRISPGEYIATAQNGDSFAKRIIDVKTRQTSVYDLDPVAHKVLEPVLADGASAVSADSKKLFYLDPISMQLSGLNSKNEVSRLSGQRFINAEWAGFFGLAKTRDNNLFTATSEGIEPLDTKVFYSLTDEIDYAVSSKNKVFVAYGTHIYSGEPGKKFKRIYTTKSNQPSIFARAGNLAIIDKSKNQTKVVVIDSSGRAVEKNLDADTLSWSTSAKYLFIKTPAQGLIYDKGMGLVAKIPQAGASDPTWLDDYTLFYGIDHHLWVYNLVSGEAKTVAAVPREGAVKQISVDGRSYLYVTAEVNEGSKSLVLLRVGLKNQRVNPDALRLHGIFPQNQDNCHIGYVNFSGKPAMIIRSTADIAQDCLIRTKVELNQNSFDKNRFRYYVYLSSG